MTSFRKGRFSIQKVKISGLVKLIAKLLDAAGCLALTNECEIVIKFEFRGYRLQATSCKLLSVLPDEFKSSTK